MYTTDYIPCYKIDRPDGTVSQSLEWFMSDDVVRLPPFGGYRKSSGEGEDYCELKLITIVYENYNLAFEFWGNNNN